MPGELTLLDTNVLVYAHYQDSEHYSVSSLLLNRAQDGQVALCITPQILTEFYAVVTNSRRVDKPYKPDEALDAIERVLAMPGMTLLLPPVDTIGRWMDLLRQHPVVGSTVFDVQLVATMLGNGVRRIYTFDSSHFAQFGEIEVLTP